MPFEMQIEFLRSREPPDISLQSIGVEGVVMTFSYKRNASAYVPYTLVGNIKSELIGLVKLIACCSLRNSKLLD